jgi:hypothetical protein
MEQFVRFFSSIKAAIAVSVFALSSATAWSQSAAFVSFDSATQGNWIGTYGQAGYVIANDVNAAPSYATVNFTGASTWTWEASTTDVRALYSTATSGARFASTYYSGSSFSVDLNLIDGQSHQVALYCLDLDSTTRSESIAILDAGTNSPLDTETVNNFHNGIWAVWNLQGHVIIRVTNNSGSLNGVVSGLFFKNLISGPAPSVTMNTPSQDPIAGPVGLTATATSTVGIASVQFQVDNTNIGSPVTSGSGSTYSVQWTNPTNGSHNLTAIATDSQGQKTTSAPVAVNVTLSGPAGPSATFLKTDTTTAGSWVGTYGSDGFIIANGINSPPTYATVSAANAATYTWNNPSSDPRALLTSPSSTTRIASTYYSGSSFSFDVNLTDGLTHQMALYCLDIETNQRSQTISILDANTSAVLSTQSLSNFNGGVYAVWNISGHIIVQVTYTGGLNAVVSGLFFGGAGTPPPPPPTVAIATPTAGTVSNSVNITASASSSVGIASVQYYLDGSALGSPVTAGPSYTYAWDTTTATNASHTLTAMATDTQGQKSATSAGVTVTVSNSVVTPPPTVSITSPSAGTISGMVTVQATATASSPASMASVQFQVDGTPLATVTETGPSFSTSWDTTAASNAGHTLTAIATDSLGHTASANVSVTVSNNASSTNSATFVKTDFVTAGNWVGTYGAAGYMIANDATALPTYATVNMTGATAYTWANPSTDSRALLSSPNSGSRIASTYYNTNSAIGSSMSFDVNLTDGVIHQVALYSLDIETSARAQTISILDASSRQVLSTQALSSFHSGVYAVWNITGHVIVQVTYTGGLNAVVSGIFFAPTGASLPPLPTVTIATPTGGTWSNSVNITASAYSSAGIASVQYYLDGSLLGSPVTAGPSYTYAWDTTSATNGAHTLTAIATDTFGQKSAASPGVNVTTSNTATPPPTISITSPTGGSVSGTLSVMATATATAPASMASVQFKVDGTPIATVNGIGPSFSTSWNTTTFSNAGHTLTAIATDTLGRSASASVTVTVSNTISSANTAEFVKDDTSTEGNWVGAYGADGFMIANDITSPPSYATVSVNGASLYTWFASTTDPRAPYTSIAANNRIASAYYSTGTFTFDVNFTDGQLHQLALYCLDVDTTTRTETITVLDAATNATLDVENIANFHNGVYEVWNITGHVLVRVTSTNSLNAVVSGLFFRSFAGLQPPAVSFTTPTADQTVSGPVTITANATSAQGMATVQFQVDGTNLGAPLTGSGPAFTTHWASPLLPNGSHTITAIAKDNFGLNTTSSVTVSVSNGAPPTPSATLVSIDPNTSGSWKGVYGQDGEIIAVDSTNPPFYANVNFVGTIDPPFTWHDGNPTTDIPGLEKADSNERIGAAFYQTVPNATFNIDVNFVDYQQHQLSLYFVDWHHNVRAQTVTIMNANNNAVLDQQFFTNFSLGVYYTWNIQGHVIINVTLDPTPPAPDSAVVSGLFFEPASTTAPPTVSIAAPTPTQTLTRAVALSANASSPLGVSSVQFELDGYPLGPPVTSGSPFTYQWNTTTTTNGTHVLNAIATDASGHSSTSPSVSINVTN